MIIRDVGPRDGLQPETPVSVADRILLVEALQHAGVRHVEVTAFVSPKAIPAMAGAAAVMAGITRQPGSTYAALVPNVRGAELALAAGVDEITVTISASEEYSQRNVKMTTAESEVEIATIVERAMGADGNPVPVDAVISCAFGSPYEGDIAPVDVVALAGRLTEVGVSSVTFADTTGMATPRRIDELVDAMAGEVAGVGLHLHDTRGIALTNAYAALERGIARFDTAVGGLGGSPFATGAGGNLATEDLVALLDDLGIETGVDLPALIEASRLIESLVGRPVPSRVAHHGPPRNS
ncbi:MAG: hydroxymethylglutaryl-CoA lyase [Aquihabitans sp.]